MTPEQANRKLLEAARSGNIKDATSALDAGADLNARGTYQATPLHWAVIGGHTDVAKLLIEKGADVNAKGDGEQGTLHLAAGHGHADIVRLLLDSGADVNMRNAAQIRRSRPSISPPALGALTSCNF